MAAAQHTLIEDQHRSNKIGLRTAHMRTPSNPFGRPVNLSRKIVTVGIATALRDCRYLVRRRAVKHVFAWYSRLEHDTGRRTSS